MFTAVKEQGGLNLPCSFIFCVCRRFLQQLFAGRLFVDILILSKAASRRNFILRAFLLISY